VHFETQSINRCKGTELSCELLNLNSLQTASFRLSQILPISSEVLITLRYHSIADVMRGYEGGKKARTVKTESKWLALIQNASK
jgi:hypothetical protein